MFRSLKNILYIKELIKKAVRGIKRKYKAKDIGIATSVSSGFKDLDRIISCFGTGNFIVIAGRPSMGKSAFALNIAQHVAITKKIPVLFFSLQMPKEELVQKILSCHTGVDIHKVREGSLDNADWPRITGAAGRLSEAPIFIDDSLNLSVDELCTKARKLKRKQNIKLIIIDYLQLLSGSDKGKYNQDEMRWICRSLKTLAEDLQIPIMATSQLSREADLCASYRPHLCDLKPDAIEQDADIFILLFREERYNPTPENQNRAEVIVAKNRTGPLGTVHLKFLGSCMRFEDIS
ncbi:MAG: DnaB-like helicase C-terminal domain-containing protein [Candidatus Omnitrophica bacterium]|nr:DnaB-like helicase C-terminal domain-containing protein [Candidatus Omnitrophota bacterium]MCM8826893.1 DnaB-like helicase C-terminal domain-containing protein [Candidatus Omnitrophota bacterium]